MSRTQDFTTGNVTKQIILFSLPMLVGNLFQQVYSMANAMIVGRLIDGDALAAVGASMPLQMFFLGVLIGLTTGASVLISQLFGAREEQQLKRAVSTSVLFLSFLGVIISAVGVIFAPGLLRMMSTPEPVFEEAVVYFRISMAGTIFQMIYNVYSAYLRALGDSKTPLVFLVLSTILNAGLDVLSIAVLHMGVAGTAISTVLSQSLAGLACYIYAGRKVPMLRITKLVFDRALLKTVLRYSLPAAVQFSLTSLAGLTIVRLVNSFGASAAAGYTAATRIDMFATMPLSNISMAISTFVGQNMGAGREDRAQKGLKSGMVSMIIIGAVVSVLALVFGRWMIAQFVDVTDPHFTEIVQVGVDYLMVIALFYTLFSVFFGFNGFFRGVGDAIVVMSLTIFSLTIRAVSAYLLVSFAGMGPEAVAWSIPIGWGLCSAFAWLYHKKRWWAGKVAVQRTRQAEAEAE